MANKDAWRLSGVVKTVKWYTSELPNVCEFCEALDGTEVGVEENFYNNGEMMIGTKGGSRVVDYGDIEAPPAHPDCACYIRPEDISAS